MSSQGRIAAVSGAGGPMGRAVIDRLVVADLAQDEGRAGAGGERVLLTGRRNRRGRLAGNGKRKPPDKLVRHHEGITGCAKQKIECCLCHAGRALVILAEAQRLGIEEGQVAARQTRRLR